MTKEPCLSVASKMKIPSHTKSKNTYGQLVDKEMKHVCELAVGGLVANIKLKVGLTS